MLYNPIYKSVRQQTTYYTVTSIVSVSVIHLAWMSIFGQLSRDINFKKEECCIYCFLCCFLLIAAVSDICSYRIKNQILSAGYIIGIGILIYENHAGALIQGFFNMMLLLICLFPVFALQVIGAGDVKLFLLSGILACSLT